MPLFPTVHGDLRRDGWETVVCVATGPSLTHHQAEEITRARAAGRVRVIVVNDGWRMVPDADVLYGCDAKWWLYHGAIVRAQFRGECWSQTSGNDSGLPDWIHVVRGLHADGLASAQATVALGGNSGYQAIGLAYLFGAQRIILVGYDCRADRGRRHFFGSHPPPLGEAHAYNKWIQSFDLLALDLFEAGIEIDNCSPDSALKCFRRSDLSKVLNA